ncbi:glycosyltransferase family 2 protein [Nonlabens sp.]|uniref:glycosyltransferase family 2 protein n=1 Tax=Nonlabens sp. TaxID=1888209 RepID=UPI003F6953D7
MKFDLISIIIPCYNREDLILETLNSVVQQSYQNWECIIVDDGSTDASVDVVKAISKFESRIKIYSRPQHWTKGAASCRNFGIQHSSGELICFLDSDDLFDKNHLEIHINFLNHNSNYQMSVSNARVFDGNSLVTSVYRSNIVPVSNKPYEDMVCHFMAWPICAVMWRRHLLIEKPFKDYLWSSEDWVLHLEHILAGAKFKILNQPTSYVRKHLVQTRTQISSIKYQSTVNSRLFIYNKLKELNKLTNDCEFMLIGDLIRPLREISRYRFYKQALQSSLKLIFMNMSFFYKIQVLKVVFVSVPIMLLTGKGESLFKVKKHV